MLDVKLMSSLNQLLLLKSVFFLASFGFAVSVWVWIFLSFLRHCVLVVASCLTNTVLLLWEFKDFDSSAIMFFLFSTSCLSQAMLSLYELKSYRRKFLSTLSGQSTLLLKSICIGISVSRRIFRVWLLVLAFGISGSFRGDPLLPAI